MNAPTIKAGDVVVLRSGSQPMTVQSVSGKTAFLVWSPNNTLGEVTVESVGIAALKVTIAAATADATS